jgi:DNA mismatch endonuclease (patch repair protein)
MREACIRPDVVAPRPLRERNSYPVYNKLRKQEDKTYANCFGTDQRDMNTGTGATPSFAGLSAASPASSHAKKMNRSSDTAHEQILRALLWGRGLRYRKNTRALPGKPDIVFPAARVAVFCDGDFWHGRNWRLLSKKLHTGANASYWIAKITANRNRDRRNDRLLTREGWTVVRFWETDIHKDPGHAAQTIEELVRQGRRGRNAIH